MVHAHAKELEQAVGRSAYMLVQEMPLDLPSARGRKAHGTIRHGNETFQEFEQGVHT